MIKDTTQTSPILHNALLNAVMEYELAQRNAMMAILLQTMADLQIAYQLMMAMYELVENSA